MGSSKYGPRPDLFAPGPTRSSAKRILADLANGGTSIRKPQRTTLPIRAAVAFLIALLVTGAIGTLLFGSAAHVTPSDPVFVKHAPATPAQRTFQEDEMLAAAIVNEPLQAPPIKQEVRSAPVREVAAIRPVRTEKRPAHSGKPNRTGAAPPAADSDIALLSAIVAHTNAKPAADNEYKNKRAVSKPSAQE